MDGFFSGCWIGSSWVFLVRRDVIVALRCERAGLCGVCLFFYSGVLEYFGSVYLWKLFILELLDGCGGRYGVMLFVFRGYVFGVGFRRGYIFFVFLLRGFWVRCV